MDLDVDGSLPHDLSGRYLCIGPARRPKAVHAIELGGGEAISYRRRAIDSEDNEESGEALLEFAGRLLALSDGSPAHELSTDLHTVGRVDLAGRARGIGAHPKLDRQSGGLYLLSSPGSTTPLLHAISPGGLTRRTRSVDGAPAAVHDLALTASHVVLKADPFIGISRRDEDDAWSWHATGATSPFALVSAYDDGDSVVVHATTPALERWNVQRDNAAVDRSVIDADPQSFGRINDRRAGLPHRYLYSVEHLGGSVLKHDLVTGARTRHDAGGARRCGQFLFAPDAQRRTDEDGGWLLGLVNDDSDHTNLVVLDAADLAFPAIAAVRLPRPLPRGLHGLWSPTPL